MELEQPAHCSRLLTTGQIFTSFSLQVNKDIVTNPFSGMLQAQGQFMTDIKHWHTALRVVRELGGTMFKQELIHIIHDVPNAVLCAWKC
jgi:hypothetical protein